MFSRRFRLLVGGTLVLFLLLIAAIGFSGSAPQVEGSVFRPNFWMR